MITSYRDMVTNMFFRKTRPPEVQIEDAEYVVIDTELTGLDPKRDSIISIGAVRMKGGRIDLGKTFYRLINPFSEMDGKSIVIHGITPSDVAEKPTVDKVLSEFVDFCGDGVIVGHFISLDMAFINREMKRVHGKPMKASVLDTCTIYEWVKAGDGSFRRPYKTDEQELDLFSLARGYGIPVNGAHNALSDALITAQLFQRFFKPLRDLGVRSLKDLLRVGRP